MHHHRVADALDEITSLLSRKLSDALMEPDRQVRRAVIAVSRGVLRESTQVREQERLASGAPSVGRQEYTLLVNLLTWQSKLRDEAVCTA